MSAREGAIPDPGGIGQVGAAHENSAVYQAAGDMHLWLSQRVPDHPTRSFERWHVPSRNPNFTGRSAALEDIHAALRSSGTIAVHSLRGMGGVGKTQLAVEYAHRYCDDYDIAWWIPSEQPAAIPHHLAELGVSLGISDHLGLTVTARLALARLRTEGRSLLIFDNAEDPDAIREFLPGGQAHVLITTRRTGFTSVGHVFDVDVLPRADCVDFLARRIPAAQKPQAEQLAAILGDLPLALEQACSYIDKTSIPIEDYIDLVNSRVLDMLDRGRVVGHTETLATLWDLSLASLIETNPAAAELLDLLAWFAPEPVSLSMFRNHPELLPPCLAAGARDSVSFTDAVGELVDYFLVTRVADQVTITHRLLQQSLRRRQAGVTGAEPSRPFDTVQELLAAELPNDPWDAAQLPKWHALLPHAIAACDVLMTDSPHVNDLSAWLLGHLGNYFTDYGGRARDAVTLHERAFAIAKARHGGDSRIVARYMSRFGHSLRMTTRVTEGLNHLLKALEITTATDGEEHEATINQLQGVANYLYNYERPVDGIDFGQRALTIAEKVFGPTDTRTVEVLKGLTYGLCVVGRISPAIALFERAIATTEAGVGRQHDQMVNNLWNFGRALTAAGRAQDARSAFAEAVALNEGVNGADHPFAPAYLTTLGHAHADLGELAEARSAHERARAISAATFGGEHVRTAFAMSSLAWTLVQSGLHDAALALFERAREITATAFGDQHLFVADVLACLGHASHALGRPGEAMDYYERALSTVTALPRQSPHYTAVHMSNRAHVLIRLRRFDEALALLEEALAIVQTVFEPGHLATAVFVSNLAWATDRAGDAEGSAAFLQQAKEIVAVSRRDGRPGPVRVNSLGHILSPLQRPLDFYDPYGTRPPREIGW